MLMLTAGFIFIGQVSPFIILPLGINRLSIERISSNKDSFKVNYFLKVDPTLLTPFCITKISSS